MKPNMYHKFYLRPPERRGSRKIASLTVGAGIQEVGSGASPDAEPVQARLMFDQFVRAATPSVKVTERGVGSTGVVWARPLSWS
jgi:hypothetical protein